MGNITTTTSQIGTIWAKVTYKSGSKTLDGSLMFKDKVLLECSSVDASQVLVGDRVTLDGKQLVVMEKHRYSFKCSIECEYLNDA